MGEGEEEHIGAFCQGLGRQGFEGQRHDTLQMGVHGGDGGSGRLLRSHRSQLYVGVL